MSAGQPLRSSFTLDLVEAGCDEVGRGCLAGPVVAAAVVLPKNYKHKILKDSKQLTPTEREQLRMEIERDALAWAIGESSNIEIDEINILNASFLAMNRAIEKLSTKPDILLIDGNRFKPGNTIPYKCIVKGDATFLSIAAASVLAKTYRDKLMCKLAGEFQGYRWESNKGYPTKDHRTGIRQWGITPFHRKSFQLLPAQFELFNE